MIDSSPLTSQGLEAILKQIPRLKIGVIGDLFLDRYLDLDASLTEPSLETGLDAYQIVNVRSSPGAAGTVINNLSALGVKEIFPIAVVGNDGECYELLQALDRLDTVNLHGLIVASERRTPTYIKPMLMEAGRGPNELNRLDIKNRHPMSDALDAQIQSKLQEIWPKIDALVVLDQVSELNCGVITERTLEQLTTLAAKEPNKFVLADSRERIECFLNMCLKPNRQESLRASGIRADDSEDLLEQAAVQLAHRAGRSVFCTDGARGILIASPQVGDKPMWTRIPAYPVSGPIDIVGAGDSTSAAIVCAMASGVSVQAAASFGNLVASITIQQIGTTGAATPEQIRQRQQEVTLSGPEA
ncbi:MAG TPA: PfkB family carbohydrate kinase [Gemmataceae bacterium]|jgi:rfaE bifunctional protein kinase chain/domain